MKRSITIPSTLILTACLLLLSSGIQAQNTYNLLPESTMQITGTSTIHDWECDVEEMNLNVTLAGTIEAGTLPESSDFIRSLTLSVPVAKIESGKGAMNRKIYDALKEKEHPTIHYSFSKGEIISRDTASGTFAINATGKLTIAGTTKKVTFPVEGSYNKNGNLTFTGSYGLNMKDYEVDPPKAMFGTIKAGEEINIVFNVVIANNVAVNN